MNRDVYSDKEYNLFEELVKLQYENKKRDGEVLTLKQKLNDVYKFIKGS